MEVNENAENLEAEEKLIEENQAMSAEDYEANSREAKRKFFKELLQTVHDEIFDVQGKQPYLNDVEIHCSDGVLLAPALLMASISPLFKALAPMADIVESPSLVLPDLKKDHIKEFLVQACDLGGSPSDETVMEEVMSVLCVPFKGSDDLVESLFLLDQDWPPGDDITGSSRPLKVKEENKENEPMKGRKRVGRKPGQKLNTKQEPYVKTEVTDSHRTSAIYGLRATVKRKKFTDEISEPSDLDDEEDEDITAEDESADEYAPDEAEQTVLEEESETDEDLDEDEDDLLEEDIESPNEDELFDSDDEIIDMAASEMKKELLPRGLETFTVKINAEGNLEAISSLEPPEEVVEEVRTPKPRGRPRKKAKIDESSELVAIGRVISVMEDEDPQDLAFKGKKIYSAVKSDPRSLLLKSEHHQDKPVPLILFCSVCEAQFASQAELKHHVAKDHKGSKFFILPKNNPHRDCVKCSLLMSSFELMVASEDPSEFSQKDICFPCPHCRRRYVGHLGGLTTHLINDHRPNVSVEIEADKTVDYFNVLKRTDDKVLTCDFCQKVMPHTTALNKHLITCPNNDSGCSAGLFCHICGKMFAQGKYLKDHLARHGKDQVNRPRDFMCNFCPVTCVSEANLQKHLDREHSGKDPDDGFVLHEGCQRCGAMLDSYLENKATKTIPFRYMVFKCPHCCMVLYANHKHAPRYLHNHINNFHTGPENDFTLGPNQDPSEFRLRSKLENDVLTCEFCGFASKTRANHNVHLSTCKKSTVPCRPGYMCDTCEFVAGTAVHLRNHLETHNDPRTYACDQCNYTGRSKRYFLLHIKNNHTEEGLRRRSEAAQVPCPKCGKLKKDGASLKAHVKKCGVGPAHVSCPDCAMEFKHKEDMQAHALIHYGLISCPIHNILFKQESEVFLHVNKAEPEEKFPKLECCICNKTFKHMCLFMKHLRKELRIAPYRCNICQKHVNTFASLQLHIKRMHSNEKLPPKEKSFKCDQCTKAFFSRGHLNEHINGVHNRGTATVPCPVCHKSFNTMKRMKKHLFNAHKESAEQFRNAEPFSTYAIKLN